MKDRWSDMPHPFGLCQSVHLANTKPEALDCHACRKTLCPACSKMEREGLVTSAEKSAARASTPRLKL